VSFFSLRYTSEIYGRVYSAQRSDPDTRIRRDGSIRPYTRSIEASFRHRDRSLDRSIIHGVIHGVVAATEENFDFEYRRKNIDDKDVLETMCEAKGLYPQPTLDISIK